MPHSPVEPRSVAVRLATLGYRLELCSYDVGHAIRDGGSHCQQARAPNRSKRFTAISEGEPRRDLTYEHYVMWSGLPSRREIARTGLRWSVWPASGPVGIHGPQSPITRSHYHRTQRQSLRLIRNAGQDWSNTRIHPTTASRPVTFNPCSDKGCDMTAQSEPHQ